MNEDTPALTISAFADGELNAGQAQTLAGQLPADPELRRAVAFYKFLDAAAARLPVPESSRAAAAEAWREVARRSSEVRPEDRRAFARMEAMARALPVPPVSQEAFGRVWDGIVARLRSLAQALDSQRPVSGIQTALGEVRAPEPDARQWDSVWRGIQSQTGLAATSRRTEATGLAPASSGSASARVDFSRRRVFRWRWLAAAGLAAAVLLGLLVLVPGQPEEHAVLGVPEAPEVLDNRYQAHIVYTDGLRSPIVCILLKDDAGHGGEKGQNWRWMPE